MEAHPTATHRPIPTAAPAAVRGNAVELVRASPGQLICRAGEPADNFYLIRRGFVGVEVESPAGPVVRPPLRAGDCFGEVAVLTALWDGVEEAVGRPVKRGVRTATCTALDHAELVMVPRTVFESFLNDKANEALRAGLQERCAEILRRDAR
jgi:CRP-like cAMP-binding protein